MIRRAGALLVAFVVLVGVAGCDGSAREHRFGESLPRMFGVRVTDGKLRIWTGSPCPGTSDVSFIFNREGANTAELRLNPPSVEIGRNAAPRPGVEAEYFTVGGPYPGFDVTEPLPAGFDALDAKTLFFAIDGPPDVGGGTELDLAEVIKGSAQHPDDTFWFRGVGWLNPAEVAAADGKKFLALCTPDPAKDRGLPRVFGVRITDGRLRVWAGAHCLRVNAVIVTFQPGQADLVFASDRSSAELRDFSVGGPYPGFRIAKALPDGFDWRTAKTVLLRAVADRDERWTTTTELAEPLSGSAVHPDDTYWFQGFGWLNPADVADHDGKAFRDVCDPASK